MRWQPARKRRTEASVAIFKDVFIGPYLDVRNLAEVPADKRGSTRIGMDVHLHYGLTGPGFCTTANQRSYITGRAIGESTHRHLSWASGFGCPFPQVKRRPTMHFTIKWSAELVKSTPAPKLNSQSGETFRSITGKICCDCWEIGSKFETGPSAP